MITVHISSWGEECLNFWDKKEVYSLRFRIRSRLGQRQGHQSTTLTSLIYKNIYWKVIYVYYHEINFQDKSIYTIVTFSNSTT
jgi:hypothetical protein